MSSSTQMIEVRWSWWLYLFQTLMLYFCIIQLTGSHLFTLRVRNHFRYINFGWFTPRSPPTGTVSPIGDGIGKFWIHRLLVNVLTSLLPARFARRMIPCPFLLRRDEGHFSGLECWNQQVGFRYISQAATSSYVELYGKKIYPNLLWFESWVAPTQA